MNDHHIQDQIDYLTSKLSTIPSTMPTRRSAYYLLKKKMEEYEKALEAFSVDEWKQVLQFRISSTIAHQQQMIRHCRNILIDMEPILADGFQGTYDRFMKAVLEVGSIRDLDRNIYIKDVEQLVQRLKTCAGEYGTHWDTICVALILHWYGLTDKEMITLRKDDLFFSENESKSNICTIHFQDGKCLKITCSQASEWIKSYSESLYQITASPKRQDQRRFYKPSEYLLRSCKSNHVEQATLWVALHHFNNYIMEKQLTEPYQFSMKAIDKSVHFAMTRERLNTLQIPICHIYRSGSLSDSKYYPYYVEALHVGHSEATAKGEYSRRVKESYLEFLSWMKLYYPEEITPLGV